MHRHSACLLFLFCLLGIADYAQEVYTQDAVQLSHYIFPAFTKGHVNQKGGSVDEAMLNYNVLSKEIIFESSPGKYLALADPTKIDTVFIAARKFVPVNSEFYELLSNTNKIPLFLQYNCTVKEPGNDIGYGMSSVTTASPAVKSLIQSGSAYGLKLPDGFQVTVNNAYWIFNNGKFQKANTARQIISIFPDKKDKINELVKKNNTNFGKPEDIVALVQQL